MTRGTIIELMYGWALTQPWPTTTQEAAAALVVRLAFEREWGCA